MIRYKMISDPEGDGLNHGVIEVNAGGGHREVARFHELSEAREYAEWRHEEQEYIAWRRSGSAPTSSRAQEAREKVSGLRMPGDKESPFAARRRSGEGLDPPTTTAPVPIMGERCPDCGEVIGETDPWQPDPDSEVFSRIHKSCLRKRGKTA